MLAVSPAAHHRPSVSCMMRLQRRQCLNHSHSLPCSHPNGLRADMAVMGHWRIQHPALPHRLAKVIREAQAMRTERLPGEKHNRCSQSRRPRTMTQHLGRRGSRLLAFLHLSLRPRLPRSRMMLSALCREVVSSNDEPHAVSLPTRFRSIWELRRMAFRSSRPKILQFQIVAVTCGNP